VINHPEGETMASSKTGMLLAGGLVGIGVIAGLYALQARQVPAETSVALAAGQAITVYKSPT
jgi:hypothetical protein